MAHEYIETGMDQIKREETPDGRVNCDEHAHVHFSIWHKHSEVLKKNSGLDKEKRWTIYYVRDIHPLGHRSVSELKTQFFKEHT